MSAKESRSAGELLPRPEGLDPDTRSISNPELEAWLRARVEQGDPAAVVRFGDAEARLLTAVSDESSMKAAIGVIEREAGLSLRPEAVLELQALLAAAFDEADVLGIRFRERLLSDHKQWMGKLSILYAQRVAAGRDPATLAPCLFSYYLIERLPEMLAGHRVSAISCRDLEPVLEGEWGLDDVRVYQVPSQYSARDVDGAYEAAMHGEPIWPDVHTRLRTELTVRERGEIFLIGAGVFGKDLCIRVRDLGGIAIDMGSALDHIAGRLTRGPERRVLECFADGMPVPEIAARMARLYETPVEPYTIEQGLDSLLVEVDFWRRQELEPSHREAWFESLRVEIRRPGPQRSRDCCLTMGGAGGSRRPLGLSWRRPEEAEPWTPAFEDLQGRGMRDVHSARVSGPGELKEAVAVAFPQARVDVAAGPLDVCADIRRAIETHGPFADEQAAAKLIAAALARAEGKRRKARPIS
jgi:hypothetical protein